jgi:hypothetical protein
VSTVDECADESSGRTEDRASAARGPGEDDILAPRKVFWRYEGSARGALNSTPQRPGDRTPGSVRTCR